MKLKFLLKDTFRTMIKTKARFLSIFCIVCLGSGFFGGIQMTAPSMLETANQYYADTNLMDAKYLSTIGFTKEEVEKVKALDQVDQVSPGYSGDYLYQGKDKALVVKVMSYLPDQKMNQPVMITGRLPENPTECMISATDAADRFLLGDTITLTGEKGEKAKGLKQDTFEIVGTYQSPLYIATEMGNTSLSTGKIQGIISIWEENFQQEVYSDLFVTMKKEEIPYSFSQEYQDKQNTFSETVRKTLEENLQKRQDEIEKQAQASPMGILAMKGPSQHQIPPLKVYAQGRKDYPGHIEYEENANRMEAIAKVFPVFFVLVAILVIVTTLTRMVDEERTMVGTLKALGYSNQEVGLKFFIYAFIASFLGSVLGVMIGVGVFPPLIYTAYQNMYRLPSVIVPLRWDIILPCVGVYLVGAMLSVFFSTKKVVLQTSSQLMRPVPPKSGQRIFLERIPLLWNRLNFSQKLTLRNVFRYKKRFFMTVIGIAGCTALMLSGFGVKDSLSSIVDKQFGEVFQYDSMIIGKDGLSSAEQQKFMETLKTHESVEDVMNIYQKAHKVKMKDQIQTANVVISDSPEQLKKFIHFQHRTKGEIQTLTDDGVLISEKLAKMLSLSSGDFLSLALTEGEYVQVKITGIVENYTFHYVYMTENYRKTLNENIPEKTMFLTKLNPMNLEEEENFTKEMKKYPSILGVSFSRQTKDAILEVVSTLDLIVLVLIVSAGVLAFIVLYNLNNVNVNERMRELATIKVLGFYPKEVTGYIYKESVLSTLIAIVVGLFLGIGLHLFIIQTAEVDILMFGREIQPISFVYAGGMTFLFTFIVNVFLYFKLKKIDMVEALKSVE